MSDTAILIENLSKSYRISRSQGTARYKTLQETLLALPVDMWSGLRGSRAHADLFWALRDVSLTVRQGEVLGIVGRNGAGKSTLLKILSRITDPSQGRAELYGRVGSLLEVGTGFHPELTGRENIFLNGAILGMRRNEIVRHFDEIVEFAEVQEFIDTPVKRYSSGMYMRLAFAVAAHLEPEILVVDEVLAVGDVAFQKKCLGKMDQVSRSGRTVLFVSHNLAAVTQICQTGVLLHHGQVLRHGDISDVVKEYIGVASASSSWVDIKAEDHVTGLNGIRVTKVHLVNSVGGAFAVPLNQPMHFIVDLEVTKPIRHATFGIGFATIEGQAIFTVHHTDRGSEPHTMLPGAYQVEVKVDNPLRLGVYSVVLGAHEGLAKTSIFYIPNALHLEVVNTNEDELYFEHNTGIINGTSSWQVASMLEDQAIHLVDKE